MTPKVPPIAIASQSSFASLLKKLLDNANAGKVVTDVGPGLFLTVPILMLASILTDAPTRTSELNEIETHIKTTQANTLKYIRNSLDIIPSPYKALLPKPQIIDQENTLDQYQYIVVVDSLLELAIIREKEKSDNADPESNLKLEIIKKTIEKYLKDIDSLKTSLDNKKTNSQLSSILDDWEKSIISIFGISVILGIILSQVNRLVFFKFLYKIIYKGMQKIKRKQSQVSELTEKDLKGVSEDPSALAPYLLAKRAAKKVTSTTSKASAAPKKDDKAPASDDGPVQRYYRYAEGSVNMAFPVLAFGYIYSDYAKHAGFRQIPGLEKNETVLYIAIAISVLLILSGFVTYFEYLKAKAALENEF